MKFSETKRRWPKHSFGRRLYHWLKPKICRYWLLLWFNKKRWIADASATLFAYTNDDEFAAWYSVELFDSAVVGTDYPEMSGSTAALTDMSYWD